MSMLRDGIWTMSIDEFYDDLAVAWQRAWEQAKAYHPDLKEVQILNPYAPVSGSHVFGEYRTTTRVGYECSCGCGSNGPIGSPWGDMDPFTEWHKHYLRATRKEDTPKVVTPKTSRLSRPWPWRRKTNEGAAK